MSVLRCRKGDDFIVFDGKGNCFLAVIREARKRGVIAEVLETFSCNLESSLDCVLVQGILKGEKMDLVVRTATELGTNEIVPVITNRSQMRDTKRVARWRKISEEAARQSGRSIVPAVHEPVELGEYLTSFAPGSNPRGFIFYEEGGISLKQAYCRMHGAGCTVQDARSGSQESCNMPLQSHSLHVLIGPEGGFTRDEVELAGKSGFIVVSLGKRVLRADTAAVSAVALVQYIFGDMG